MDLVRAGLVRCTRADDRLDRDDRRALVCAGLVDGIADGGHVLAVADQLGVPAVGIEALEHVLRPGHGGGTVELDAVVVVERDELAQPQVAGQAGRLGGDAFLQVAVRADGVGVVVDHVVARPVELRRQPSLGHGHAHRVGEALAEGTGRGLHPRGQAVLGVARRPRAHRPEALELIERQVVPRQVEHRVEQRAGVACAQHEAVAIEPVGPGGRVLEEAVPQGIGHGCGTHGRARMAAVGLLDGIDGQDPDGVDGVLLVEGRGAAGQVGCSSGCDRRPKGSAIERGSPRARPAGCGCVGVTYPFYWAGPDTPTPRRPWPGR